MFCEKARAAVCQQQSPQAEVLLTDGTIAVVAANTSQLVAVNFGPIDMVLMDASNVSVSVLTSHLKLNVNYENQISSYHHYCSHVLFKCIVLIDAFHMM